MFAGYEFIVEWSLLILKFFNFKDFTCQVKTCWLKRWIFWFVDISNTFKLVVNFQKSGPFSTQVTKTNLSKFWKWFWGFPRYQISLFSPICPVWCVLLLLLLKGYPFLSRYVTEKEVEASDLVINKSSQSIMDMSICSNVTEPMLDASLVANTSAQGKLKKIFSSHSDTSDITEFTGILDQERLFLSVNKLIWHFD